MSESLASQSDAELLKRFSKTRCENAFEELVDRYGRLVMSISSRALQNQHDAEDVFQATFLVLAKNANKIRKRESLPSWLSGVAYRLSMKLALKRHRKDLALNAEPAAARDHFADLEQRFDEQAMDEELQSLPSKYRDVLVRFYLLGQTSRQIAEALGITQGAADGRIKRGRQELRVRLAKRGVALGAFTVMALSAKTASAAVAPSLAKSAVAAAVAQSSAGVVTPAAMKLAGSELMKTSSMISSVVLTSAVVALLGLAAFGLNLSAARAIAGQPMVDTRVSSNDNQNSAASNGSGLLVTQMPSGVPVVQSQTQDDKPRPGQYEGDLYRFKQVKAEDVLKTLQKKFPNVAMSITGDNELIVQGGSASVDKQRLQIAAKIEGLEKDAFCKSIRSGAPRVGLGDRLRISIPELFDGHVPVRRDGTVSLMRLDPVRVAGCTVSQVIADLKNEISRKGLLGPGEFNVTVDIVGPAHRNNVDPGKNRIAASGAAVSRSYRLQHHPADFIADLLNRLLVGVEMRGDFQGNTVHTIATIERYKEVEQALEKLDRKDTKLAWLIDTADIYAFKTTDSVKVAESLEGKFETGLVQVFAPKQLFVVGSDRMRKAAREQIEKLEADAFKHQVVTPLTRQGRWEYVFRVSPDEQEELVDKVTRLDGFANLVFVRSGKVLAAVGTASQLNRIRSIFVETKPRVLIGRKRIDQPPAAMPEVVGQAVAPQLVEPLTPAPQDSASITSSRLPRPIFSTARLSQDGKSVLIEMPNAGQLTETYNVNVPVTVNGRVVLQTQTRSRTVIPAGPQKRVFKVGELRFATVGSEDKPTAEQLRDQLDGKTPIMLLTPEQSLSPLQKQTLNPSLILISIPKSAVGKAGRKNETINSAPQSPPTQGDGPQARMVEPLGLELAPIDRPTQQALAAEQLAGGLRVVSVREGGLADKSGIREADILVGLGAWETTSFRDLEYILRQRSTWNDQTRYMVARDDAKSRSALTVVSMPLSGSRRR